MTGSISAIHEPVNSTLYFRDQCRDLVDGVIEFIRSHCTSVGACLEVCDVLVDPPLYRLRV